MGWFSGVVKIYSTFFKNLRTRFFVSGTSGLQKFPANHVVLGMQERQSSRKI